jgi:hypothetical protein
MVEGGGSKDCKRALGLSRSDLPEPYRPSAETSIVICRPGEGWRWRSPDLDSWPAFAE